MKELVEKHLDQYLEDNRFTFEISGEKIEYWGLYQGLKKHLLPIHAEVTAGAILDDIESQIREIESNPVDENSKSNYFKLSKVRWLNDHGPNHIKTVIKRATQLLANGVISLTEREVYFLLSAIHLHDIGNIFGRIGHERRIMKVVADGKEHIGTDRMDRIWITKIAEVHGGTVSGTRNKDTISQLDLFADYDNEKVRLRLLASILRFADELAEEKYRGSETLLENGKIPKGSEIFHLFSLCVSSIGVEHSTGTIKVQLGVNIKYLEQKFGKGEEDVYIIDEIYTRMIKMHLERIYCSRFWKPDIQLEKISVRIVFYSDFWEDLRPPDLTFTLEENGYPQTSKTIFELCPDLVNDGVNMDGSYYNDLMRDQKKVNESI